MTSSEHRLFTIPTKKTSRRRSVRNRISDTRRRILYVYVLMGIPL